MPNDNLTNKIRRATSETLKELELSDTVSVDGVQRQADSPRFIVDLSQQVGSAETKYYSFAVQPEEAITAGDGPATTIATLKPFVSREVQKLFPE